MITHAKVHAWGEGFNDSFDVFVHKHLELYNVCISYPGYDEEQIVAFAVTKYEILSEIMGALVFAYRNRPIEQLNITFDYGEE